MKVSHNELEIIYKELLPTEIKDCINEFIQEEIDLKGNKYNTKSLWITDQQIGGIGGYCMPADANINPFSCGIERELYRPLQYAKSYIEICDVNNFSRFIVQMCGMHLESVCRLYLKNTQFVGSISNFNTTLGKAVKRIDDINDFNKTTIKFLYNFVKVYNRSKHEINQDESKERLFNACDAITAYFSARILGVIILKELNIDESLKTYELYEDKALI